MKRILKSRRGAAIESALFFMLVVFALSMLLVASVSAMSYRNLADERAFKADLKIEQIGYYFALGEVEALEEAMEGYTDANENDNILHLQKNGKTLLYIELYIEKDGNDILAWCYEAPAE